MASEAVTTLPVWPTLPDAARDREWSVQPTTSTHEELPQHWWMLFLENVSVSAQITLQRDLAKNDFSKGLGRQLSGKVLAVTG